MGPPRNRSAAPSAKGSGGSGRNSNDVARQSYTTAKKFQQPGVNAVYDGRTFRGAVLPQRGRWVAFDASGHRVGDFEFRHRAEHALSEAARPGGGA